MGYQRNIRKSNMATAKGKEIRGRPRNKPQPPTPPTPRTTKRKPAKATKPADPQTRVGASQQLPITLDSDDDNLHVGARNCPSFRPSANASLLEPDLGQFRYQPGASYANVYWGGVYSPLQNAYAPAGFVLRRSSPAASTNLPIREKTKQQENHTEYGFRVRKPVGDSNGHLPDMSKTEEPAGRKSTALRRRAPYPTHSATNGDDITEREPSVFIGPSRSMSPDRPTNMRNARTSHMFSRIKVDTPGPWQYRSQKTAPNRPTLQQSVTAEGNADAPRHDLSSNSNNNESTGKDMTLADTPEYGLRAKVTQLMAVAPALPVRDLYHLIIDSKGHLSSAKKQAIRMSEAPLARHHSVRPSSSRPAAQQDEDGDEIMVKINLNDPAFEFDTDEPLLPEPALQTKTKTNARPSKPKPKPLNEQSQTKGAVRPPTKRTKSEPKSRPNIGVKRTKSAPINPTHARETSFDREFVVPDNTVHCVSSDSDEQDAGPINRHEDSDIEMIEDELDLDIDMNPRYAYNAGLLGKTKARRKG